jgi:hypothetical protein
MFHRRPSPALVISIISLIVALGGTAAAASHYLITNSSQIKNGVIKGADLRNGTITKKKLAGALLGASASSIGSDSTTALEAHRQAGPQLAKGGKSDVVSLPLGPGVYAIFAKTVMSPDVSSSQLLDILKNINKTSQGDCSLNVEGTADYAAGSLTSPNSTNALTVSTQLTRSLASPGQAVLSCESDVPWHAADASIIALKVGSAPRTETP